jgi:hypothetical protein
LSVPLSQTLSGALSGASSNLPAAPGTRGIRGLLGVITAPRRQNPSQVFPPFGRFPRSRQGLLLITVGSCHCRHRPGGGQVPQVPLIEPPGWVGSGSDPRGFREVGREALGRGAIRRRPRAPADTPSESRGSEFPDSDNPRADKATDEALDKGNDKAALETSQLQAPHGGAKEGGPPCSVRNPSAERVTSRIWRSEEGAECNAPDCQPLNGEP